MPTLAETDPSLFYAMFKGEPGLRKSTQALSFLPMGRQYWFSWDRKMGSMQLPAQKWGYNPKDVVYDDYFNWDAARIRLERFQVQKEGFQTLVFDSITSCADMILRQQRKGKGDKVKKLGTIETDGIEEFNAESSALNELISLTKDIQSYHKINIIMIAHVMKAEYRNTVTNETHISRTIVTAGKRVAVKIPAYCTEVYHFDVKKGFEEGASGTHRCLTQHTGDDFARTSYNLPREIEFGDKPLYDGWIKGAIAEAVAYQQSLKQLQSGNPASPVTNSKFTS